MTLRLEHLRAGYHGSRVIHDVSLTVASGVVHAVVGHNGAGKTTLLDTVAGLRRAAEGRVLLGAHDVSRASAHRRNRGGLAYVPQGARVFASLTVHEHLTIANRATRAAAWTPARVTALFPALESRRTLRAGHLSGGEKQMLAIARALLTQPEVLLLDEPTEGLAPTVVREIVDTIGALAAEGIAVLLATPQPDLARQSAHEVTVLAAGRTTTRVDATQLRGDPGALDAALVAVPSRPTG